MKNTALNIFILLFIGVVLFVLSGCSNNISFNRESAYEQYQKQNSYKEEKKEKKSNYIKSNGYLIYKTNDSSNQKFDIDFGPGDVKFNSK